MFSKHIVSFKARQVVGFFQFSFSKNMQKPQAISTAAIAVWHLSCCKTKLTSSAQRKLLRLFFSPLSCTCTVEAHSNGRPCPRALRNSCSISIKLTKSNKQPCLHSYTCVTHGNHLLSPARCFMPNASRYLLRNVSRLLIYLVCLRAIQKILFQIPLSYR